MDDVTQTLQLIHEKSPKDLIAMLVLAKLSREDFVAAVDESPEDEQLLLAKTLRCYDQVNQPLGHRLFNYKRMSKESRRYVLGRAYDILRSDFEK